MALIFDNKRTKVQQLAEYIQQTIVTQNLKAGDSLPSINSLTKEHNVSRDTVYKALVNLKEQGLIDSLHGKSFFVNSETIRVLVLLDEYSQFKEVFYQSLLNNLPKEVKVDMFFHHYNENFYDTFLESRIGVYNKYLVMSYENERMSEVLKKFDRDKLLLLDYGNFEKEEYSFVTQCFGKNLYATLESVEDELNKYEELVLLINKKHKHPETSKEWFQKYCKDKKKKCVVIDEIIEQESFMQPGRCFIVIKQEDIVELIKSARGKNLKMAQDYGLIAYNDMPFYDVIDKGISAITIDWKKMGKLASEFVKNNHLVQEQLPSYVVKRNSF